ncbi:hypothetical protein, partial [Aestuariivirga sp.]|uniref:hypothetical protein n=1 Tax=Aestuariivirga sp. TaxID=2650926 RepID=UPI003784BDB5
MRQVSAIWLLMRSSRCSFCPEGAILGPRLSGPDKGAQLRGLAGSEAGHPFSLELGNFRII